MDRSHYLILIADDDPGLASLMREILSDEGYDTLCCFSGAAALAMIQSEQPHLAILDLQMESSTAGLAVVQQLREDSATADLPVILCSAAGPALAALRLVLADLGCTAVPKPFNIDHLLATVATLVQREPREQAPRVGRAPAPPEQAVRERSKYAR